MKRNVFVILAAALLLFVVTAAPAMAAAPNGTVPCSNCHAGAGPAPIVTLVSDNGTTATYGVQNVGHAWAAFDGTTYLAGGETAGGTFSGQVGHTFSVFMVSGFPGPFGTTTVGGTYAITPSAGANGSISPATAQTVASGASVTFTITANAGYHIEDVIVNGASVGAVTSYTFNNVTANGSISATFAIQEQQSIVTIALTGLKTGALKYHHKVTVKGSVKPARIGEAMVTFQRKAGAEWVVVKQATATVNPSSGAYGYSYRPLKTGSFRVQTAVAQTDLYSAAASAWKVFKVK